jgi:hypothetical protein
MKIYSIEDYEDKRILWVKAVKKIIVELSKENNDEI